MTINAVSRCVRVPRNVDGKLYGTANLGTCGGGTVTRNPAGGTPALNWSAASLADGETLTITTDGTYNFGSTGPTVIVYHDYAGKTAGQLVANSDPQIGAWSGSGNYSQAIYAAGGRDGSTCASMFNTAYASDPGTLRVRAKHVTFSDTSEVFACWTTKFPGGVTGSGTANVWPTSSHWKHVWVSNNNAIGTSDGNDVVLYTHSGSNGVSVAGNDTRSGGVVSLGSAKGIGNYNFTGWNVYQCWLKGGASPLVDNATVYACFSNANYKAEQTISNKNPFATNDATLNYAHIPGFWGNLTSSETGFDPLLDDVYFAAGSGAAARVLIGDASTWVACRELWIAPPTSWSVNTISCRIPRTATGVSGMYLYVFDASNNLINATGLLL